MSTQAAGKRVGRLVILDGWTTYTKSGNPKQILKVRCDCGAVYTTPACGVLYSKRPADAGCKACRRAANAEQSATGWKHPLYPVWQAMVARCHDPRAEHYAYYGGRGVQVCARWLGERAGGELRTIDGFRAFLQDMGPRPKGHSLDRVDNDGPYAPNNCRWATALEQANNKRSVVYVTALGETHTISEWGRRFGHATPDMWAARAAAWGVDLSAAAELLAALPPGPISKWKLVYASLISPDILAKPRKPRAPKPPRPKPVYPMPYIKWPPK